MRTPPNSPAIKGFGPVANAARWSKAGQESNTKKVGMQKSAQE
jgi:hypothetical protein